MFGFEMKTTHNLEANPAEGLHLKDKTGKQEKRAPFNLNDLELMFIKSQQYSQDKFRSAHAFWIPIIGLYTGARLEEICQAEASDIRQTDDGIWVLDVNENGPLKSNKTSESRLIPLHPFLLELGLHRYAQNRPERSRLWPKLKYYQDKWGHRFSQDFSKFKNDAGIDPTPDYKVFHSFRHTVSAHLKNQDIPEVLAAELLGHKHDGITYGHYGEKARVKKILNDVVMKLDFHEHLDFSHLLRSRWAFPGN